MNIDNDTKCLAEAPNSETLNSGTSDRLKKCRLALAASQAEMDGLLSLGKRSWQRYETGDNVPGSQVIAGLVRLGFNANWVLTGEGPMRMDELVKPGEVSAGRVYVPIPRHVKAGEGHEVREVDVESEIASLSLSARWIEQKGLSPVNLVYMRIPSDALIKVAIHEGGLVAIDSDCDKIRGDGIYAIQQQGIITVKRLQPDLTGGGVRVISDNTAYPEQHLTQEQAKHLDIIGRVVWVGGSV